MEQEGTRTEPAAASLAGRALDALPGVALVCVFLVLASVSGGFFPQDWYAAGLFLLAFVVVTLFASRSALLLGVRTPTRVAILALGLFTVWSYASISWAEVPGDAWDGANRTALYLVIFCVFALTPWTPWSAAVAGGFFALGIPLLGAVSLLRAASGADPGTYFIQGRFSDPIGYPNGNAALFVLAFWPALFLASRSGVPVVLRGAMLAAAGVCLQLATLPQSRGAVLVFPVAMLIFLALVPGRLRALASLVVVGGVVLGSLPRLLEVAEAQQGQALAEGSRDAIVAIGVSALLLFGAGLLLAKLDGRLEVPPRLRKGLLRTIAAVAFVGVFAGAAVVAARADPLARVADAWEEFTSGTSPQPGGNRFTTGFETSRHDLWRVALSEFRAHPIRGLGAENFGVAYLRERRTEEETLYPHSFPLGVLVQTGAPGALAMLVFLCAALWAAWSARSRQVGLGRGVAALGVVMFGSWLAHASLEWFWEFPALAGPALGFLALAGSLGRSAPTAPPSWATRLVPVLATVLALAIGTSFFFPWLAARETRYATKVWRADLGSATKSLERARRLNPLNERPDLAAGSIALLRQDWATMADAYSRAAERNPVSWYVYMQRALALAQLERVDAARASLRSARRLNPTEPLLDIVEQSLARDGTVDVAEITGILAERHRQRTR